MSFWALLGWGSVGFRMPRALCFVCSYPDVGFVIGGVYPNTKDPKP